MLRSEEESRHFSNAHPAEKRWYSVLTPDDQVSKQHVQVAGINGLSPRSRYCAGRITVHWVGYDLVLKAPALSMDAHGRFSLVRYEAIPLATPYYM